MKVIITQEELNAAVIAFFGLPLDATVVLEGSHTSEQPVTQPVAEEVVVEEVKQVRTRRPRTKKVEEAVSEPEVIIDSPIVEVEAIEVEVETIKEAEKKSESMFQPTVKEDPKPATEFKASSDSPFCDTNNESKESDSKPISSSPFFFNVSEEEKKSVTDDLMSPYANAKPLFS